MATPPKKWPHQADWARSDSIRLASKGRTLLLESLDDVNDPALLRRIARAIETFREIETRLRAVGPKTETKKE